MARGWLGLACVLAVATHDRAAHADDNPSPTQRASIFAKGSVVRVVGYWEVTYTLGSNELKEYVGGTGSGFFVSADGFVVTNAHVVEDIQLGEERAKEIAFKQLADKLEKEYGKEIAAMSDADRKELATSLLDSAKAVPNALIVLPDGTKKDYVVKAYGKPGSGTDVSVIKVDLKDCPNLAVADSDEVTVQDKVLAIGYPGAADMEGLLDDKSQLEATINEGAVSALKHTADGDAIIQISASITHGNSGGPTINEHGEVIGLSTFGSTGEVQGFNFIVASATVKKFLDEAKVDVTPSATTKAWHKGLDEYWDHYMDEAITDFEDVLLRFPMHSEAPRMEKLARAAKAAGKSKTRPVVESAAVGSGSAGAGSGKGSAAGGAKPSASTATMTTETGSNGAATGIAVGLVLLGLTIGGVFVVKSRKKPGAQPAPGMHPPFAPGPGPGMPMPMHPHAPPGMQGVAHPGLHPHGPHAMMPNSVPVPIGGMPMMHGPPGGPQPMMAGGRPIQQVAKTMAISGPGAHAPVAATAFGSLSLGILTCTRGGLNGQRFALTAQGILIGRQPGLAQIVIDDSRASGKHVWIGYEQGQLVAIDQGTTNGTFVNDVRFGRISKAPLKDGDTVIVSEPDCLSLTLKLS